MRKNIGKIIVLLIGLYLLFQLTFYFLGLYSPLFSKRYKIEQKLKYINNEPYLSTIVVFEEWEIVWHKNDVFLKQNDSLKKIRYNEALNVISRLKENNQ